MGELHPQSDGVFIPSVTVSMDPGIVSLGCPRGVLRQSSGYPRERLHEDFAASRHVTSSVVTEHRITHRYYSHHRRLQ